MFELHVSVKKKMMLQAPFQGGPPNPRDLSNLSSRSGWGESLWVPVIQQGSSTSLGVGTWGRSGVTGHREKPRAHYRIESTGTSKDKARGSLLWKVYSGFSSPLLLWYIWKVVWYWREGFKGPHVNRWYKKAYLERQALIMWHSHPTKLPHK